MYVAAVDPLNAHWAPCLVYDGQQRLSTVTLILKVLSRHLKDDTAPDGFGPDQIRSEYLVNPFGKGDQHYRLVLKAGDAETLLALIHDRPLPAEPSSRIMDALAFFEKRIKQIGPDVSPLCAGLRKLRIVALPRRFITCCLRFTTGVAARHARLASGWRAAPLPGGSRTRWIATRGFSSCHPPLQGLPWRDKRSVRPWHRPAGRRVRCAQMTDLGAVRPFTTSARPGHHGLAERIRLREAVVVRWW